MATLIIRRAGVLCTVQDLGRPGWGRFGVPVSGAMDALAARAANALVDNPDGAPLLELTGAGAALELDEARVVALTGADLDAVITGGDAAAQPAPRWGRVVLTPGQTVTFRQRRAGARALVAVAGGLDVAAQFGSAATDLGNRLGGVDGRPLGAGDGLPLGPVAPPTAATTLASHAPPPPFLDDVYGDPFVLRLLPADGATSDPTLAALLDAPLLVTPQSNRVGFRLHAADDGAPPARADSGTRLSEPIAPGTVQVPPDGQPILLMADRQTVGGYPVLGHVIAADLARAAQLWPGDRLRFHAVDRATARAALERQTAAVRAWRASL